MTSEQNDTVDDDTEIDEKEIWTLPPFTQAALNAALFELRDYTENVRDVFDQRYPGGAKIEDEHGSTIEAWLEDLEHLLAEMDTLEYAAQITR